MPLVSVDVQALPVVHSEDVLSLISGVGMTRYQLKAKVLDIYSNSGEAYWYFPEKIYVERYDSLFLAIGSIIADTAYYFERKELWHVIGNVVVKTLEGRIFETSELFWDVKAPPNTVNAFYTDKPVKVTEPDGNIYYGLKGFRADQDLIISRLFEMKAEFYVEESTDSLRQDTAVRSDSLPNP